MVTDGFVLVCDLCNTTMGDAICQFKFQTLLSLLTEPGVTVTGDSGSFGEDHGGLRRVGIYKKICDLKF